MQSTPRDATPTGERIVVRLGRGADNFWPQAQNFNQQQLGGILQSPSASEGQNAGTTGLMGISGAVSLGGGKESFVFPSTVTPLVAQGRGATYSWQGGGFQQKETTANGHPGIQGHMAYFAQQTSSSMLRPGTSGDRQSAENPPGHPSTHQSLPRSLGYAMQTTSLALEGAHTLQGGITGMTVNRPLDGVLLADPFASRLTTQETSSAAGTGGSALIGPSNLGASGPASELPPQTSGKRKSSQATGPTDKVEKNKKRRTSKASAGSSGLPPQAPAGPPASQSGKLKKEVKTATMKQYREVQHRQEVAREMLGMFAVEVDPVATMPVDLLQQSWPKLRRALCSGVEEEVHWGLNALVALSYSRSEAVQVEAYPGLLDELVALLDKGLDVLEDVDEAGDQWPISEVANLPGAEVDGGPWWWQGPREAIFSPEDPEKRDLMLTWAACASSVLRNCSFLEKNQQCMAASPNLIRGATRCCRVVLGVEEPVGFEVLLNMLDLVNNLSQWVVGRDQAVEHVGTQGVSSQLADRGILSEGVSAAGQGLQQPGSPPKSPRELAEEMVDCVRQVMMSVHTHVRLRAGAMRVLARMMRDHLDDMSMVCMLLRGYDSGQEAGGLDAQAPGLSKREGNNSEGDPQLQSSDAANQSGRPDKECADDDDRVAATSAGAPTAYLKPNNDGALVDCILVLLALSDAEALAAADEELGGDLGYVDVLTYGAPADTTRQAAAWKLQAECAHAVTEFLLACLQGLTSGEPSPSGQGHESCSYSTSKNSILGQQLNRWCTCPALVDSLVSLVLEENPPFLRTYGLRARQVVLAESPDPLIPYAQAQFRAAINNAGACLRLLSKTAWGLKTLKRYESRLALDLMSGGPDTDLYAELLLQLSK